MSMVILSFTETIENAGNALISILSSSNGTQQFQAEIADTLNKLMERTAALFLLNAIPNETPFIFVSKLINMTALKRSTQQDSSNSSVKNAPCKKPVSLCNSGASFESLGDLRKKLANISNFTCVASSYVVLLYLKDESKIVVASC